jgi:predicted nucleotidyltransferase
MNIDETVRRNREAILRIAAKHGASEVRLIGSVARGEAGPDSDVDLLVTWREGSSLLDQAALMLELESLLGRKVDIASDGWVKPSIRESVYRDAPGLGDPPPLANRRGRSRRVNISAHKSHPIPGATHESRRADSLVNPAIPFEFDWRLWKPR